MLQAQRVMGYGKSSFGLTSVSYDWFKFSLWSGELHRELDSVFTWI